VVTDAAPVYLRVLDELVPRAWHHVEQYANNRIEADHGRLKHRLRPMRGLRTDRTAAVIIAGLAFMQNRLIHEPPVTWIMPGEAGRVSQQRREPLHPPMRGDVIDVDAALGQQLLYVPEGQSIAKMPAHRQYDRFGREPGPGEG
jgi:hypothetical protein